MRIEFDHVGILVHDVKRALESLQPHNWPSGEIEAFPSEGTKEVYIGPPAAAGRLLLIEPIGEGPYREALAKRGPGLHHIAINIKNAVEFTERISGSGWYLHPQSLSTFKEYKTLWLARPGVPLLVEVVQRQPMSETDSAEFISRIEVPLPESKPLLAAAVGLDHFRPSPESDVFITIAEERRRLADLVAVGGD